MSGVKAGERNNARNERVSVIHSKPMIAPEKKEVPNNVPCP